MDTIPPVEPGPSEYRLQVLHVPSGQVVQWAPGLLIEKDLVDEVCRRVAAKGVGFGKTEAHVLADVKAAVEELFFQIKVDVTRATS